MQKTSLQEHQSCPVQKTARKNTEYSRNETILEIGYLAKAIAHAKKRSKKHQIFKKRDDFENRPYCKGSSQCKGYSLGKMVSFGQKSQNMPKTILLEHQSCSVQKTARKNTKYLRTETIFKIGNHPKAIAHAKSPLWVKN